MKITQNINFFVPHTQTRDYETSYEALKTAVKYQMGWPVADRRIESLTYTSNKKQLTAKIGEVGEYEHQYFVVAILESAKYIIVTKTQSDLAGPTVLVDTKDVVEIRDFTQPALSKLSKTGVAHV